MRSRLVLVWLVLAAGTARAGNIAVEFEGMLTVVQGIEGASFGTPFAGTYTFDSAAAVQSSTATSATYAFGALLPATGYSFTIFAPTPVVLSGSPLHEIKVGNAPGGDSLAVVANPFGSPSFRLDVTGGPDLFSSLALAAPAHPGAGGTIQYTDFGATSGMVLLMGSLTSITTAAAASAPEPASALLLGLGLGALAWRRARV
jgi:hypothetical protein